MRILGLSVGAFSMLCSLALWLLLIWFGREARHPLCVARRRGAGGGGGLWPGCGCRASRAPPACPPLPPSPRASRYAGLGFAIVVASGLVLLLLPLAGSAAESAGPPLYGSRDLVRALMAIQMTAAAMGALLALATATLTTSRRVLLVGD